ncbi:MAG: hypothetical protein ABSE84_26030 [Isosphaeraceae bacterium]
MTHTQASLTTAGAHSQIERLMFDQLRDYQAMESAKRACRFAEAAQFADQLTNHPAQMNRICPFFGYEPYPAWGPDWEGMHLRQLAAKTDGSRGRLVAVLPEVARGRADPFDNGRFEGWQRPTFDDSAWQPLRLRLIHGAFDGRAQGSDEQDGRGLSAGHAA